MGSVTFTAATSVSSTNREFSSAASSEILCDGGSNDNVCLLSNRLCCNAPAATSADTCITDSTLQTNSPTSKFPYASQLLEIIAALADDGSERRGIDALKKYSNSQCCHHQFHLSGPIPADGPVCVNVEASERRYATRSVQKCLHTSGGRFRNRTVHCLGSQATSTVAVLSIRWMHSPAKVHAPAVSKASSDNSPQLTPPQGKQRALLCFDEALALRCGAACAELRNC